MDYVICLCYSSEKGFYTKCSSSSCGEDEVIFRPHEQAGFRTHKITIPEAQIEIKISTNFGYGSMSYLIATISKEEIPILDFSAEKLCVLNNAGVQNIVVKPRDWNDLFLQIINTISGYRTEKYYNAAKAYMAELCRMNQAQSIEVKRQIHIEKTSKWDTSLLVLLRVSDCLRNLLSQLMAAHMDREDITNESISLCRQYLSVLATKYPLLNHSDTRMPQIEDALYTVHQYLYEKKVTGVFLETLMGQQSKHTDN